MINSRIKGTKKIRQKRSVPDENVQVHTSLPPKVDGQLRCYLKLKVSHIAWLIENPPDITNVRVLWWGEDGKGTLFRPIDGRKETRRASSTTARYGIRSGPKQFAAYLVDMGSLVFEVLSGTEFVPVGRAQIAHISALTPSKPITGYFPVFSADSEKIAELKVSVILESLMASYDSTSSVPTPDMSIDFYGSATQIDPPINQPRTVPGIAALHPGFNVNGNGVRSSLTQVSSGRETPIGVDAQLYSFVPPTSPHGSLQKISASSPPPPQQHIASIKQNGVAPGVVQGHSAPLHASTMHAERKKSSSRSPPGNSGGRWLQRRRSNAIGRRQRSRSPVNGRRAKTFSNSQDFADSQSDLLATLLARGQKLREAMIVSAIDVSAPSKFAKGHDGPHDVNDLGDIDANGWLGSSGNDITDEEEHAVDLVLGVTRKPGQFKSRTKNGGSSPMSRSLSGDEIAGMMWSDPEDPLHDSSVIHDLFYKSLSEDLSAESDNKQNLHKRRAKGVGKPQKNSVRRPSRTEKKKEEDGERSIRSRSSSYSSAHNSLLDPGNQRPPSRQSISSPVPSPSPSTADVRHLTRPMRRPGSRNKGQVSSSSRMHSGVGSVRGRKSRRINRRRATRKGEIMTDSGATSPSYLSEGSRSEGSRVSFDPTPSDSERNESGHRWRAGVVDGLSVQRLTLLGRVHVARVVINSLTVSADFNEFDPARGSIISGGADKTVIKGKPPTPTSVRRKNNNRTYFVEYQFPVVATSRDKKQPNTMATEVVRVVSKKTDGKLIGFGHRTVFPVMFDAESLEKWWSSALVLKVYSKSASERVPKLLGMCCVPLKSVLKSNALVFDEPIEVKDRSQQSSAPLGKEPNWPLVGLLKVSIELASDSKDFATALAATQLAEMRNPKIVAIPQERSKPPKAQNGRHYSPVSVTVSESSAGTQTEPLPMPDIQSFPLANLHQYPSAELKRMNVPPPVIEKNYTSSAGMENYKPGAKFSSSTGQTFDAPTLHALLIVSEGFEIKPSISQSLRPVGRDVSIHNLYVISRMFWCEDIARSDICWGTADPQFNFVVTAPMLLTRELLERMRNNFMIIEVWEKMTSSHDDQLVGIVKLPLHQFYMSYRDRKISSALLHSQYPVSSVDGDMPVINPFTGGQNGHIRVVLAMGSQEQITAMHRTRSSIKDRLGDGLVNNPRVVNIEHIFEIVIDGISGLRLLESMIWGEADCFVQYFFPSLSSSDISSQPSPPILKTYRTAPTLCIPDPIFNDVSRHKLLLPSYAPVQREIVAACAGVGGGAGGVPIELWCRYYNPATRNELMARTLLPVGKLCAMITSKKSGDASTQSFSLPLEGVHGSREEGEAEISRSNTLEGGLLEMTITYRNVAIQNEKLGGGHASDNVICRMSSKDTVCISVSVMRATGLQSAAIDVARRDSSMKYPAEVGVNSYVRVRLSFLPTADERLTRTVARSFAPDYCYHMDFPCPIIWTEPHTDATTLAEVLDRSEAIFELWHQVSSDVRLNRSQRRAGSDDRTDRSVVSKSVDILLGTVHVPLVGLLMRKTGISGWYPVNAQSSLEGRYDHNNHYRFEPATTTDPDSIQNLSNIIGGLELSIKFAHHSHLERLLNAASEVGWYPSFDYGCYTDDCTGGEGEGRFGAVSVGVDAVCFPLHVALSVGQTTCDASAACYIRYKLYDKKAVCSMPATLKEEINEYLSSSLRHTKKTTISISSPFQWYLREEQLEIQVWITSGNTDTTSPRPHNRDKHIGSAYLDISPLANSIPSQRHPRRVMGVFPLFKAGAARLDGACLSARIMLLSTDISCRKPSDDEDDWLDDEPIRGDKSRADLSTTKRSAEILEEQSSADKTSFAVHIGIERAFHLPMVLDRGEGTKPSCYVSYQTTEDAELTYTQIVGPTNDPVWCHENDTHLSRDLLMQQHANLVFKVWHKPQDVAQIPDRTVDRVLGFVSVDLAPLTKGFPHLCGFYNIIDFNGVCQGQIKVSIVPTDSVGSTMPSSSLSTAHTLVSSSAFIPADTTWYADTAQGEIPTPTSQLLLSTAPRFNEHFESVKRHHSQLQQRMHDMGVTDPSSASRSMLFSTLRTNLKDLDDIVNGLRRRLGDINDDSHSGGGGQESSVPLSTSSMLYTFGTSTGGGPDLTSNWGNPSLLAQVNQEAISDDVSSVTETNQRSVLGSTGGTTAVTKDAIAELLQQTLDRTGSTGMTTVASEGAVGVTGRIEGVSETTGAVERVQQASVNDSGKSRTAVVDYGDYTAPLQRAQNLLASLQPVITGSHNNDNVYNSPETEDLFNRTAFMHHPEYDYNYDEWEPRGAESNRTSNSQWDGPVDSRQSNRASSLWDAAAESRPNTAKDSIHRHQLQIVDDRMEDNSRRQELNQPDEYEEEEDTFSNIWTLRTSQRRSSSSSIGSLSSTVISRDEVTPARVINDIIETQSSVQGDDALQSLNGNEQRRPVTADKKQQHDGDLEDERGGGEDHWEDDIEKNSSRKDRTSINIVKEKNGQNIDNNAGSDVSNKSISHTDPNNGVKQSEILSGDRITNSPRTENELQSIGKPIDLLRYGAAVTEKPSPKRLAAEERRHARRHDYSVESTSEDETKTSLHTVTSKPPRRQQPEKVTHTDTGGKLSAGDSGTLRVAGSAPTADEQGSLIEPVRRSSDINGQDRIVGSPKRDCDIPNFFLRPSDMEQAMQELSISGQKRLKLPPSLEKTNGEIEREKVAAARELMDKRPSDSRSMPVGTAGYRTLPTVSAEQAQRIAKIFAQKY